MSGGELTKATVAAVEGGAGSVTAWFNPETYNISKNANWSEQAVQTQDDPIFQWTSGKGKQLSFSLFMDGYEEKKSVQGDCESLLAMASMDSGLHRPPKCKFSWGSVIIEGVILSVKVDYTMFLPNGTPVRAKVDVQMSTGTPKRGDNTQKKQSPDWDKLHTLRRGETLHAIAEKEYDDASEWRRIADANGIDNPMDLVPGMKLFVPPILTRHGK
ncbi:MAG: LysM peptidoglycan-binding domain-containing protein [Myxococcota bacterium]|jgi:nucleoid-associated protein YgaU|nr:LysM peptidoglycan-binding domain-containing protein [Myxococcota bacterium]